MTLGKSSLFLISIGLMLLCGCAGIVGSAQPVLFAHSLLQGRKPYTSNSVAVPT